MDRYSHTLIGEQADALDALPDLSAASRQAARATGTDDARPGDSVLASCLALSERFQDTRIDSRGCVAKGSDDAVSAAKTPENKGETPETKASGSVWESNPLTAFFKPSAGFEDQGLHQKCKHSQRN